MDFLSVRAKSNTKNRHTITLEPHINLDDSEDIIIKGGGVYAIYDENKKIWVTDMDKIMKVLNNDWVKK